MRRIRLFFLTTLVLLCSALTSWAAPYSGSPSESLTQINGDYDTYGLTEEFDGYYVISSAEDLYGFAAIVNNGSNSAGFAKAVLTADIVVNLNVPADGNLNGATMHSWTPIGTTSKSFKGTFDGNGHTISGLYFDNPTDGNYPAGGNHVGLIGYAEGATIKNVGVIDSYIRGYKYVGGICGQNYVKSQATITNCYNTGTVSGSAWVGGISGEYGTITNCYNTGTVSGSSSYVGGISGYHGAITDCYNTGTVSGSAYSVGGICGGEGTQTNCYNTGTVSGNRYVGGICGIVGTQTSCYYLEGCAKDGQPVVQYGVGNETTGQTTADVTGKTIAATAEEFASGEITYLLNGSTSGNNNVWRQNLDNGAVDAYPVLDKNHGVIYYLTHPCATEFSNSAVKEHPSMTATGYCTACGQFIAHGTLVTESNRDSLNLSADFVGYYAISNSGELYWFADLVNNGETTANAVLTADIVVNENVLTAEGELNGTPTYSWTPIGTTSKSFKGTFDGNGHTISGLYFKNTTDGNYPDGGNHVGLIGIANGAKIKNVGVIDSYIKGYQYVGGICGEYGTQTNCYNTGKVSGASSYVGGICGSSGTLTNCYNTGAVSGSSSVGGVCGLQGTQTNCYNIGRVSGASSYVGGICGSSGTQTNCYYLESCAKDGNNVVQYGVGNPTKGQTTADKAGRTTAATAEEFASGRITYLLNGSTSGNYNTWRQKVDVGGDVDAYPVLDKNHPVVYATQPCTSGFSNTEGAVQPHSTTTDAIGRCTACGKFIAQGTLVTENNRDSLNLSADFVGYYAIGNAAQLYWFAQLVNGGGTGANAVLTADIVVNENVLNASGNLNGTPTYSWTPIKNYSGTFDGNGHTISGLYFNNTTNSNYPNGGNYVGLIGYAYGGTIKNVGVIDSYIRGHSYVGGICGCCYSKSTTITNCYNTGTVSGASSYVGGICGYMGTQTNCYNIGKVSGSQYFGVICGAYGTQTNCYYLNSTTTNSGGATAEEFASGKIGYQLNSGNNTAWHQNLFEDASPVLNTAHNSITGYVEVEGEVTTVVGDILLVTDYEIAAGKTLCVPAGASLTTTGEATITNNGTLVVNGTIAGNNLAGSGSFLFNDLIAETDFVLNTTNYTYKGSAYTLESGIDFGISHTILGKEFTFGGSYTATYSNNTNTGTATVTLTNNADAENVVSQQFTISAKDVELVWGTETLTYNGTAQAPSATVASGSLCGSDVCNITVTGAQTNAGTGYTATASELDNANYTLPEAKTKEFSIGAKEVELVWGTETLTYNGTAQALSATVASGSLCGSDVCNVTVTGAQTNAGINYVATASELDNANYTLPEANTKEFSIGAKEVELVWGTETFTYKGTAQAPTATVASGSLCGSDVCNITVTGAQTNAGTGYTATASELDNANYTLPEAKTKEFSIGAKEVELVWGTETFTYNGTAQAPSATVTSGSLCGSDVCNITVTGAQTNAGTGYTATASELDNANYKLPEAKTKEFAIGKATPTYTLPTIAVQPCNAKLADIQLGSGFAFASNSAELAIGENKRMVVFTPENTTNYEVVENIELTINVSDHVHAVAVYENVKAATCTAAGSQDSVVYCSVCKEELSRKTVEIEATGHTAGEAVAENLKAATCTQAGSVDSVVYCTVCKEEISRKTVEIKATGHTAVTDTAVAATTTETGLTEGSHCSVCGEVIVKQEVIPVINNGGGQGGNEGQGEENNQGQGGEENNQGEENQGGNEQGEENQGGENQGEENQGGEENNQGEENQGGNEQGEENQGEEGNQGEENQGGEENNQGEENQGGNEQGEENQGEENQGGNENQGEENQGGNEQGEENQGGENQGEENQGGEENNQGEENQGGNEQGEENQGEEGNQGEEENNQGEENQGGNEQGEENQGGNENQGEEENNQGGNENEGGNENTNPGTAVDDSEALAVNIYAYGNTIVVENATEEIYVYNAMGALICKDVTCRVRAEITINTEGVYIVKTGKTVKRVMVE